LSLQTAGSERIRITSGGVMQIANASGTQGTLVGSERLNVNGGIYAYNGITSAGALSGTSGNFSYNVVVSGGYGFQSNNGSKAITFQTSLFSGIDGIYQNVGNTNDFAIYTNGGASTEHKFIIKNNGNILVGNPTDRGTGKLQLTANGTMSEWLQEGGNTSTYILFSTTASTGIGSIQRNPGGGVTYNTTSDYRLKHDLKDYSGLDIINKIKTYDFAWNSDNTRNHGVMAHELQQVIPYAVTGEKDGERMQGVDYSKLVPVLVKAIQELEARIKILENK